MSLMLKTYAVLCAIALSLAGCPAEEPRASQETKTFGEEQTSRTNKTYVVYAVGGRWEQVTNVRESFLKGAAAGGSTEIPRVDFTQSDGKPGWAVGPYAVIEY